MGMEFEWDENKRKKNLAKHGLDFWFAVDIFEDANRIEYPDERKDYGENRMIIIGKITKGIFSSEIILCAVYTDRNGKTRIISARKANKKEKKLYHDNS